MKRFISAIGCITAIISVIISICTLRQNSKMIEATARPYVAIEIVHIENSYYFKLKNYGNSNAIIDNIEINDNVKAILCSPSTSFFTKLKGLSMPPGYVLMNCIDENGIQEQKDQLLKFGLKYHSSVGEKYEEQQEIDFKLYRIVVESRRNVNERNAPVIIAKALQDIIKTIESK